MNIHICNRCVMDDFSDYTINFDENGHCNYCREALIAKDKVYFPNEKGQELLDKLMCKIKKEGKNKQYDCIMGLSGGLDSSYLAYLGSQYKLRILAIHVDDGFNAPVAVDNIRKLSTACNVDVIVEKPDKEQFYALTAAFIRAGVPNIAIPQDNLILGYLHKYAKENKIRYFLSGGNFALESILQRGYTHSALDKVHIKDINKKFGTNPIDKLQVISSFQRKISNKMLFQIEEVRPLNYIDYRKDEAIATLKAFCDFNYYGGKHYESIFTKFVQVYYLPKKFHVDKRKSHFSSLIISGQLTRGEALEELKKSLYNDFQMDEDINFILKCLKISRHDFDKIMLEKPRRHEAFSMSLWTYLSSINRKLRGY